MTEFRDDLQTLINRHSLENGSNTPDGILADYLNDCLVAYNRALQKREAWYGRAIHWPADTAGFKPCIPDFGEPLTDTAKE